MEKLTHIATQTFSSLSIRNYRLYFLGQIISLSGTWMQTVAQGLLVLKLTGSGTILGIVTALQFLPLLLLGPVGGVWADRFPKRKILYVTQTLFGILALILGILVVTHTIKIWELYLLALGIGFVNLLDNPTRQAFVSEMVGTDHIQNAVSLNSSVVNLARVIGPALAGVLITTVGIGMCFIVNGLSYIPVLLCLSAMRKKELYESALVKKEKGQIIEGFTYVRQNPKLFHSLVMMAVVGAFAFEFSVILPLFSQFTFHGNATTYTILTCALGIGAVVGGLFTANRKNVSSTFFIRISVLFGIAIAITAMMPTFVLACVALLFVGFFSIIFMASGNTLLQLESDPSMRGRVMSLWSVAFLGSTPIGGPIIGFIGGYSARLGLGVGGLAAILAGLYGFVMLRMRSQTHEKTPVGE
jgi:MFS family permease